MLLMFEKSMILLFFQVKIFFCLLLLHMDSFPLIQKLKLSAQLVHLTIKFISNFLNYISFLLSAPGVEIMTFVVVIISAPLAVAAPLNIFSTISLKVSTIAPSVTYSAFPFIWYLSRLCALYTDIAILPPFSLILSRVVSRIHLLQLIYHHL